jgi:GT2 family glycosyltransferase
MPPKTRVHLVAVLYNSANALPAFLAGLVAQEMADWRLLAIDNGSRDNSAALVEAVRDGRITVVRNSGNLGFAQAANQGMRASIAEGADLVALINPDTLPTPDFLRELLASRERHHADVLSPRIMQAARPAESWYAGGHFADDWVFRNVHEYYDPDGPAEARNVGFASGCCLLLTRAALARIGVLDERFFVYWEDADLCLRLGKAGIPIVYDPQVMLLHEGGASSGGEFSTGYSALYYRSYMQFLRKHFGLRYAAASAVRLALDTHSRSGGDTLRTLKLMRAMARGLITPARETPPLSVA